MKIISKRNRKEIKEIITYKTDLGITIVETKKNGKHNNLQLIGGPKGTHPILLDLPEDWVDQIDTFDDILNWEIKIGKDIDAIDDDKLYFMDRSYEVLYNKNNELMSVPFFFDYCGSLSENYEDDPNYAKLIKLLKKHKYVKYIKEHEIPYYNSSFPGQKGILRAKVYLPNKEYIKLYEKCLAIFKKNFYMHRMKDYVEMAYPGMTGVYGKRIDTVLEKYWKDSNNSW